MFSNQLVGLGDGRERVCDSLNINLISFSVSPGPYPGGKTGKDNSFLKDWLSLQEGIKAEDVTVSGPVFSIFVPSLGSLWCSNSISNCVPRKQEITGDAIFVSTRSSCHERLCGSGKFELKYLTR